MNRSILLTVAAAFMAVGCNQYEIVDLKEVPNPLDNQPDPCIEVTPASVAFEPIEVMVDPPQTEVITISNSCTGDLEIYDLALQNPDYPFNLGTIGTVLVPSMSSTDFTVTFEPPTSSAWNTKILIDSNDPETPTATVDLYGEGVAPVIEVDPESHDFGAPYIGCQLDQPYTVMNIGNADLEVDDFEFATGSTDFSFDSNPGVNGDLPFFLSPGLGTDVYVNYMGLDEFADTAFLTVESNDPWRPEVLVTAEGAASLYGKNLDVFEQAMKSSTDIIFTLDRSGSMYDDNALVVANFGTFINTMAGLDADYHVAVVVEDDGCVLGSDPYIDNTFSSSNAESTFETQADIYITLGHYGSNTERGFSLAEAGLKSANIGSGGCNEGMYREDAFLSLVHVSDEPEQSVNPYTYYVSLFQSMKSDPDDVVINAVAGDYPGGCGSASPGTGYYEGTVATGGLFLSICATDWGSHLESLAEGSVSINDSFELTQLPVPETIEVTVDGIRTTTGWEYDATINSIVFERDHIPAGGSTIEVEYHLMPDCES